MIKKSGPSVGRATLPIPGEKRQVKGKGTNVSLLGTSSSLGFNPRAPFNSKLTNPSYFPPFQFTAESSSLKSVTNGSTMALAPTGTPSTTTNRSTTVPGGALSKAIGGGIPGRPPDGETLPSDPRPQTGCDRASDEGTRQPTADTGLGVQSDVVCNFLAQRRKDSFFSRVSPRGLIPITPSGIGGNNRANLSESTPPRAAKARSANRQSPAQS